MASRSSIIPAFLSSGIGIAYFGEETTDRGFVGGGVVARARRWDGARSEGLDASSLRENEGESVSRIAIRLKILSGPWILGVGLVGASGKKVFP